MTIHYVISMWDCKKGCRSEVFMKEDDSDTGIDIS